MFAKRAFVMMASACVLIPAGTFPHAHAQSDRTEERIKAQIATMKEASRLRVAAGQTAISDAEIQDVVLKIREARSKEKMELLKSSIRDAEIDLNNLKACCERYKSSDADKYSRLTKTIPQIQAGIAKRIAIYTCDDPLCIFLDAAKIAAEAKGIAGVENDILKKMNCGD